MRTKTLLTAAAALAVGLIASQTQAQVYSANIVGYVTAKLPANQYTLMVAPLSASPTNTAEQLFPNIQVGDAILTWNGVSYDSVVYLAPGSWIDADGNPVSSPSLLPGEGFFYQTSSGVSETNVTTGTVILTNSMTLPKNTYNLIGSAIPIGGSIESTNFNFPFQVGDAVLTWSGSGYQSVVYLGPGSWIDADGNPVAAPTLSVGEAFFYQTSAGVDEQWNQNLTVQ